MDDYPIVALSCSAGGLDALTRVLVARLLAATALTVFPNTATADPGSQTVTAIAYRWGFSNASRFATQYQQAYGVRPSHTLHQD